MSCSSDPVVSRAHRQVIGLLLLVAAAIVTAGILALILTGGAAAEEVHNGTVVVENDTANVWTNIEFADVSDANAAATVTITDANGSVFVNETINGNGTEIVTKQYSLADADPAGTYTVVVDASNGTVADVGVGTTSESSSSSGGGGAGVLEDDSRKVGLGVAIVVIVLGAIGLARRADT